MNDLHQLEEQLAMNKAQVEKGATIARLLKNPDFQKIIITDFCRDEVVRSVNMAHEPGADQTLRSDCLSAAAAGGHLKRYLRAQEGMALAAENQMLALEQEIEQVRVEEIEG